MASAAYMKFERARGVVQSYDSRTGNVAAYTEDVTRFVVLDFLDTIEPADVYSICEVIKADGDKEIVVYFKDRSTDAAT